MNYESIAEYIVRRYGYIGRYGFACSVDMVADKLLLAHRAYKGNPAGTKLRNFLVKYGRLYLRHMQKRTMNKPETVCLGNMDITSNRTPLDILIRKEALDMVCNKELFGESAEYVAMLKDGYSYAEISTKFGTHEETVRYWVRKTIDSAKTHYTQDYSSRLRVRSDK